MDFRKGITSKLDGALKCYSLFLYFINISHKKANKHDDEKEETLLFGLILDQ